MAPYGGTFCSIWKMLAVSNWSNSENVRNRRFFLSYWLYSSQVSSGGGSIFKSSGSRQNIIFRCKQKSELWKYLFIYFFFQFFSFISCTTWDYLFWFSIIFTQSSTLHRSSGKNNFSTRNFFSLCDNLCPLRYVDTWRLI